MILKLNVISEHLNEWPAREGRAAGANYELSCVDWSDDSKHNCGDILTCVLSKDDQAKYAGKLARKVISFGCTGIRGGGKSGKILLRGSIIP